MITTVDEKNLLSAAAGEIGAHLPILADVGPHPDCSDADKRLVTYVEGVLNDQGYRGGRAAD